MESMRCGEIIRLSGTVYTARDAAHKRFCESLQRGEPLPVDLENAAIYYCGPTPAQEGEAIGSCGPTTSSRMDDYAPALMDAGVRVMIGKGKRSQAVNESIKKHRAIYLAAIGGAGALYKHKITACECVAYADLGCEAVQTGEACRHRRKRKHLSEIAPIAKTAACAYRGGGNRQTTRHSRDRARRKRAQATYTPVY